MQRPAELSDLLSNAAWLRRLADYLVRGTVDAPGDVVQETWVAALRSPPSRERPARPWLAAVLRNVLRRRHRDRERLRRREAEASLQDLSSPSPQDLLEQAEAQQLLGQLVLGLGEPYRTTVLLRYFEDLAPAEIARRTGEPAGTVRWRLNEAMRRLRAELAAKEGPQDAGGALRALAPLLPAPAPAAFGSSMKGGTLAMALTAKTKAGAVAVLAAIALGAGVSSRLDDREPGAGAATVRTRGAAAQPLGARLGGNSATPGGRSEGVRTSAPPKLQSPSSTSQPTIYGRSRDISIEDLPPHFRSVLDQIALGRPIRALEERRDLLRGSRTRTRLSFHVDGVRHEVMLDDEGRLVASEVDFEVHQLPPVVLEAIKAEYPEAEIVEADRQWRDDQPVYFDVNLRQDGRPFELHLSEEGRITKRTWK
jgi:RNA polymerase sigma factor (sigma-70 family)